MGIDLFLIVVLAGLVIGVVAGICSGLFGLGGGIVVIPCLLSLFAFLQVPESLYMHLAIGTSVTATSFSTCVSVIKHARRGGIIPRSAAILAPTVIVASVVGSLLGNSLPDGILRWIFGIILALIGLRYIWGGKEALPHEDPRHSIIALIGGGLVIGILSSLLGVGGGFMVVPLLIFLKTSFKQAVGTAAVTSFCITVTTAISYLFYGFGERLSVPYTFAYIFLPAALGIAISASIAAPLGVKLAHVAPVRIIKRIFGVLLIGAGASMIFGSFH